ncbi:hypothetical protein [Psychrilyobacter atlanticus]|uniref:hypothetical protein n=1 Tax=Psychrilyobacter atlanticus TaxID=271091 RepID=UPI0003F6D0EB|nr:hypothetical protein [Psychrilyobacter atlanticus]
MIKLIGMSVQEIREALENIQCSISDEIGIGKGNLGFLEEMLEHKSIIGFAFNLGREIDFFKNDESLAETGQKILSAKKHGIERGMYKNFGTFKEQVDRMEYEKVEANPVEELEILGFCYLLEGLKYHFKNDIYILLEIETKFTNFTKKPDEAVKFLLDLQEKHILLDDVEKYFEEKLSLEERQNLEKIMKKYEKMEL